MWSFSWAWRRVVLYRVTSQKTALSILTSVKTSNLNLWVIICIFFHSVVSRNFEKKKTYISANAITFENLLQVFFLSARKKNIPIISIPVSCGLSQALNSKRSLIFITAFRVCVTQFKLAQNCIPTDYEQCKPRLINTLAGISPPLTCIIHDNKRISYT